MRRILVTNDDGINADGLRRLVAAAQEFGEVWIVAPERQRSACSHSITLHESLIVYPCSFSVPGIRSFSCSGTPSDCIRLGCLNILPQKPDVVLTGINYGFNIATDIQYSGTVGAAFEAAFQNCHAIAISEAPDPCHEIADAFLSDILASLIERPLPEGQVFNVNFPKGSLIDCKGILTNRTVSHAAPYEDHYNTIEVLPDGGTRFMVEGIHTEEAEEGTDFRAVIDQYISIGVLNNIK